MALRLRLTAVERTLAAVVELDGDAFRDAARAAYDRLNEGQRVYVGGVVANSPDNLVRWIVSPQTFSPRTAMPATGITEAEGRDVAAYLYSR